MKLRLLSILLFLIIFAALYFSSPWREKQAPVNFESAGEIIRAAQAKTKQVSNYRYKTDILIGEEIRVTIQNRVIRKENRSQLVDFSWEIPKTSGMTSMYAEGEKLFIFHPLRDKWLLPSEEPTGKPFLDFFWKQLSLVDPVENLLKTDPNGTNITIYSAGNEQDHDSIAVQVIPRPKAQAEITKALPPQLSGAELTDLKQLFWISRRDLLVTRYEVTARVGFFGFKTMDFKAVSEAMDYNKTGITLPKALLDKMKEQQ